MKALAHPTTHRTQNKHTESCRRVVLLYSLSLSFSSRLAPKHRSRPNKEESQNRFKRLRAFIGYATVVRSFLRCVCTAP